MALQMLALHAMESKENVQNNEFLNLNSLQFPSRIDNSKGPLSDRFWLALWDAVACGGDLFCFMVVNLVVAMKCGWIVRVELDAG